MSGGMQLLPDPLFSIPTDNTYMVSITATDLGRIFMAGKDGCLYEVAYQAEAGWLSQRCRKINHSKSSLSFLIPSVLQFSFSEDGNFWAAFLLEQETRARCRLLSPFVPQIRLCRLPLTTPETHYLHALKKGFCRYSVQRYTTLLYTHVGSKRSRKSIFGGSDAPLTSVFFVWGLAGV